jgi:hypothetical protein
MPCVTRGEAPPFGPKSAEEGTATLVRNLPSRGTDTCRTTLSYAAWTSTINRPTSVVSHSAWHDKPPAALSTWLAAAPVAVPLASLVARKRQLAIRTGSTDVSTWTARAIKLRIAVAARRLDELELSLQHLIADAEKHCPVGLPRGAEPGEFVETLLELGNPLQDVVVDTPTIVRRGELGGGYWYSRASVCAALNPGKALSSPRALKRAALSGPVRTRHDPLLRAKCSCHQDAGRGVRTYTGRAGLPDPAHGEDANDVGAALDLSVKAFQRVG